MASYAHLGAAAARPFDWRLVLESPPLQQLFQDQVRAILRAATLGPARILVPLNFTREGRFRHDPAVPIPPLPDLAPAAGLARLPAGSHEARVVQTSLLRGMNRVVAALNHARRAVAGEGRN